MNPGISLHEPKIFYRTLDRLFGTLDQALPQERLVQSFLDELFKAMSETFRLKTAVLFAERRDTFECLQQVGAEISVPAEIDPAQQWLELLFTHHVYIYADPEHESAPHRHQVLPKGPAAAIVVGRRPNRYVILMLLSDGWVRDELDFALNTVRVALSSRLIDARVRGTFLEAAEIQQSLLVEQAPDFAGYEIAFRSIPAEEVGGDFCDFAVLDKDILGLSIGVASGHGLPAALLVRDVVIGMRMGLEKDLKMVYALSKLNGVIHRSTLSSRFVSMFYGELERNGNLLFVNAGHQPPLLFLRDRIVELATGDTVIGPLPEVRYKRSFAHVDRGSILVMYTDGLVERRDENDRSE